MGVSTAAGVTFGIGTTASIDESTEANAISDFQNDTYSLVGEVESIGEVGDEVNPVNFTSLLDQRVRKFKGSRDAGSLPLTVGFDAGDTGQSELREALRRRTQDDNNFRIVLNDGTEGGSGTEIYFYGKVMSRKIEVSSVDNIVRATFSVAINSEGYQIDAT